MLTKVKLFIDESYYKDNNIYGICVVCVTKEDIKICENLLENLEFEGIILSRDKSYNVLHYVDDDISTRMKVFEFMRSMPFSAHVVIVEKQIEEDLYNFLYKDIMWKIINPLIQKQLKSYKQEEIEIIFENISDKTERDLKFFTDIFYSKSLEKVKIIVSKKEKNKINFAPDYILGIIMEILTYQDKKKKIAKEGKSWMVKAVEIINPKLSVVFINISSLKKRFTRNKNKDFLDYINR